MAKHEENLRKWSNFVPPENFFRGWRIDYDLRGTWRAESPDWGRVVEARTFKGLIRKMRRAKPRRRGI